MRSKLLDQYSELVYGFSTAEDGNMAFISGADEAEVVRNREQFLGSLDISIKDVAALRFGNGAIELLDESAKGRSYPGVNNIPSSDAAMTTVQGLGIMGLVADCTAGFVYDPIKQACGLVHMKWETTDQEIALKFVERMVIVFNSNPDDLIVYLGPGIKQKSYLRISPIQARDPRWQPHMRELPSGQIAVDVVGFNRAQLIAAGVRIDHIEECPVDTGTDHNYFSSYRAKYAGDPDGRMAAVMMMRQPK